jgi:hypothetical protein
MTARLQDFYFSLALTTLKMSTTARFRGFYLSLATISPENEHDCSSLGFGPFSGIHSGFGLVPRFMQRGDFASTTYPPSLKTSDEGVACSAAKVRFGPVFQPLWQNREPDRQFGSEGGSVPVPLWLNSEPNRIYLKKSIYL